MLCNGFWGPWHEKLTKPLCLAHTLGHNKEKKPSS